MFWAALLLLLLLLQAEKRYRELTGMGLEVKLVLVGNKGRQYFSRRPQYNIASESTHPHTNS
jgi:F0F1-type ATP synthase gamma subunit